METPAALERRIREAARSLRLIRVGSISDNGEGEGGEVFKLWGVRAENVVMMEERDLKGSGG